MIFPADACLQVGASLGIEHAKYLPVLGVKTSEDHGDAVLPIAGYEVLYLKERNEVDDPPTMLTRMVLRKRRDESGMKKGKSGGKPLVRIRASTLRRSCILGHL